MTLEPPAAPGTHAAEGGGSALGEIRCPRCQAPVAPDQDWCLECGAPARTRLAPSPNWRMPIVALAIAAVLAGAGLAVAFVALTNDSTQASSTATSTTAPVVATEPTATAPPTTPTLPTPTTTTPKQP